MNSKRAALVLTLAAITAAVTGPAVRAQTPVVDPAAVKTLQRMTDYMSRLQQFSVHTQNTLEYWLDSGQRIDYDVAARVTVRRPNKIRADRVGELIEQKFYYDGKTLTIYRPTDGVYTTQPAPGTIEELLDFTRESLGIVIPVEDLVYRNAFAILMANVRSAIVVGKSVIGGVTCDHLAFSRPDIDFQVWVAEGDRPLPCKYVVTDPRTPPVSTVTVMSDWNVAPTVADAEFKFMPPEGARSIPFVLFDKAGESDR